LSPQAFVHKIKKAHEFNDRLISEKLHAKTEFGISHFAGPVTYEANMFMERNTDKLQQGLLSLAAMTSNTIIAGEFKSLLEEHAVNDTAGVVKKKATSMTLLEKFRIQLRDLMATMEGSQTRYIRCIKPNNTMTPKVIDQLVVFRQLQCAGLVTAIEISRGIFPNKLPYAQVEERFACLMEPSHLEATRDMELHDKVHLMVSMLFAPLIERFGDAEFSMPFACGKTKVYFRSGALENLEGLRHDSFSKRAIILQGWNRKLRMEQRYILFRKAVIQMQAFQRTHLARSLYRKRKQEATSIQSWVRLISAKSRYQQSKKAAMVLAAWSRSWICLLRFRAMKRAATNLETWVRSHVASTRFHQMKRAILSLQAHARGHPERARFQMIRDATVAVQTLARVQLGKKAVIRYRQEAVLEFENKNAFVIQGWWRLVSRRRARYLRQRELIKFAAVQIWWQKREAVAATVIQSWSRVRAERIRFQQTKEAAAAAIIQSWSRARPERMYYQRKKEASSFVQAWYRTVITQRAEQDYKIKSSSFIQTWYRGIIAQRVEDCKRRANDVNALSDIQKAWRSSPEEAHIVSPNNEHTVDQEMTTLSIYPYNEHVVNAHIVSPNNEHIVDQDITTLSIYPNNEHAVDQDMTTLSIYRQEYATRKVSKGSQLTDAEIAALREEVHQVTTEAEMHLQEVQTDFEDKLIDYEDEVLQLNQNIRRIQEEKMSLQEEVTTAQQNYVTNIQRLKKGMRKSHDSHKEYLNQVMGMLEETNRARKAETERITRELESVKLEKDATVAALEEELDLLRKLGLPAQRNELEDDNASGSSAEQATAEGEGDEKTRLTIQKLETVLSPENLLEVVCAAQRQPGCTAPYIDKKITSKCRKLIARLEIQVPCSKEVRDAETQVDLKQEEPIERAKDVRDAETQVDLKQEEPIERAKDETIDLLQQQLVWAYEAVESLQMQICNSPESALVCQRSTLFSRNEG
jgi:myosin heavy subunit